ncbi:MAG: 2,3-bisphosphoglycerate-independent phosphoglycerate mutase [Mycoplasma sp.]|nr:2,3-bisphosphoglycerate-independent phosphoglycerate mutase [Mycoplasma sp.]
MQNKRVLLAILDGFGYSPKNNGNAICLAKTPNIDQLLDEFPCELVSASGESVGLPIGQMGNSEVGHMNMGAGRIVYTGLGLIDNAIKTHQYWSNKAFLQAFDYVRKHNSKLHIMGLVSHGGVHSSYNHIVELIKLSAINNIHPIMHIFSDGRDVDPHSFANDLKDFGKVCEQNKVKIATISGRFYAMDRDKRWDRVELAYENILGKSKNTFSNLFQYVNDSYAKGTSDEFILPAINSNYAIDDISLNDNDAVIFINFRADRARELTHCICCSSYYDFLPEHRINNIFMVTMTKYEGMNESAVAFNQVDLKNTIGEVIANHNLSQLRIAETEKYAHVTFFFDGGKEVNYKNEEKILIPSPKVQTYDLKPEMSANEITDNLLPTIGKYDLTILNFANPDMVGHTGNLLATIKAIETVDTMIGKIYSECKNKNVTLFIIGDHGNAECMLDDDNNIVTKHTTNPVWFIITDKNIKISKDGKLGNIAPTILEYMGIDIPKEMDQPSLIKK